MPITENRSSSTTNSTNDPLNLSNSDHPGAQLVASVFNGSNFLAWSRAVKLALGAKNKLGFVNGKVMKPASTPEGSDDEERWIRCDYMVRCWLLNSMIASISEGLMYADSSKRLWDELNERYGQSNGPLLFQLKRNLCNTVQGSLTVVEYYNKLQRLWDEIFSLEGLPECVCARCTCQVNKKVTDLVDSNKTLQFLMGLADSFEHLRSHILSQDPIPSLSKVYALAHQIQDTGKGFSGADQHFIPESSALNTARSFGTGRGTASSSGTYLEKKEAAKKAKMEKLCTNCNQRGHLVDQCFKIHGFPEWFKELKAKTKSAATVAEVMDHPLMANSGASQLDHNLATTVCQEVMKMLQSQNSMEFSGSGCAW